MSIMPEKPLLIMYNEGTDELGLSADGYDLVVIANFIVFNRIPPYADDYEAYSGGRSWHSNGPVMPKFGYIFNETLTVQKDSEWTVIGLF